MTRITSMPDPIWSQEMPEVTEQHVPTNLGSVADVAVIAVADQKSALAEDTVAAVLTPTTAEPEAVGAAQIEDVESVVLGTCIAVPLDLSKLSPVQPTDLPPVEEADPDDEGQFPEEFPSEDEDEGYDDEAEDEDEEYDFDDEDWDDVDLDEDDLPNLDRRDAAESVMSLPKAVPLADHDYELFGLLVDSRRVVVKGTGITVGPFGVAVIDEANGGIFVALVPVNSNQLIVNAHYIEPELAVIPEAETKACCESVTTTTDKTS